MNGFFKSSVCGRVTNVANGVVKNTGKKWCRFNIVVREWNFGKKTYESQFFNVVGYDFTAEKMASVEKDTMVYAEGRLKVGKEFKTNSGETVTPWDLECRNWHPVGKFVWEEKQEAATENNAEADPFG